MPSLNPIHWDPEQFATLLHNTSSSSQKAAHSTQEAIATHHPLSAYAGQQVLQLGGSATDALVTMIAVDTVVQPGTSTLAGSLGLILHESVSGETYTLNAGFNRVLNDSDDYDHATHRHTGRAVLVPGVVAGLESLWHRFGILPWADLWRPAIYFAREGFILNDAYVEALQRRQDVLLRHPEGRAIFAPDGKLPEKGNIFRQPQLAETLKKVSLRGTTYFYKGEWARHLINAVHRHGGAMRLEDMQLYQVHWEPPLSGRYLNYEILTLPPPHYGGALLLYALSIAEELELHTKSMRTESAETLFEELQTFKTVLNAHNLVIDPQHASAIVQTLFNQTLTKEQARTVAASIQHKETIQPRHAIETNAQHIVIVDRVGNIISAAHTNASDAWGDSGIFVEGIALNSSADQLQRRLPRSGERISEPLAAYIVLQASKPLLAAGANGAGFIGCNLQNILNILAHKMSVEASIGQPRWGNYASDNNASTSDQAIQIENFAPDIIQQVELMGQPLKQASHIDTGYWTAVSIDPKTGARTAIT
jgi:gamma-glutamyltranspeptidase/glutathione hydrolase